jgi:hypothetical protein
MALGAFHPEDQSRAAIDAKLEACGWVIQNRREMNLGAGPDVAASRYELVRWAIRCRSIFMVSHSEIIEA